MSTERLIQIISKSLYSQLTTKEQEDLDIWLDQKEANRNLYRKLCDKTYLAGEYDRWVAIDTSRALHNMERRVKKQRGVNLRYFACAMVGAAISCGAFLLTFQNKESAVTSPQVAVNYLETIKPGHSIAELTQSNGQTITLETEIIPKPIKPAEKLIDDSGLREIAMNSLKTPRGGEFHIFLEDSTEVWLNAESSLDYPETFGQDKRLVTVSGEVYFKVHKEVERPFFVKTEGQVVRVYGTEFSVSSYPNEDKVFTTLVEGKVGILPDEESSSVLFLNPDHQVVYSKIDSSTVVKQVDSKLLTSWKDGLFVFEDQSLEQIMVQLSRWYDFEYRFADEESKQILFKGRIPRYGRFGDFLEILEKSGGICFSSDQNCVIISKK